MFAAYLEPFAEHPPLQQRLLTVLEALPVTVRDDFLGDARFHVTLDNFQHGRGSQVWMACPGPGLHSSRNVVLRPRLADCSEAFAHYVIAHELAHAYLRNGGWGQITDPESAADALASEWGFPRPR